MFLDRSERNALFYAIQEEGLDPRNFDVVTHNETQWKLQYRAWGTSFAVLKPSGGDSPISHRVFYKVGNDASKLTNHTSFWGVTSALKDWLKGSKADHETPDLWAELSKEPRITELAEGQENTPFSAWEQRQIADVIAGILTQARETYELPDDKLRLLEAKLDYLVDAARHTRRIDWLNTAVGAIAGAFAGGFLTPDVAHKVLGALSAGLGPLFGHPLPLLGP